MPRPSLPVAEKLTEVVNVKLKRQEALALARLSKVRRHIGATFWTKSAILRELFLNYLTEHK